MCWKKKHRTQSSQRCVVDLNDVTFIDKSGERLLRAMSKKGAELVANGMYTAHLLEKVRVTGKGSLSKLLICFFAAVVVAASVPTDCVQVGPTFAKTSANDVSSLSKSDFTNEEGGLSCAENS
jgi:hypothetical protein